MDPKDVPSPDTVAAVLSGFGLDSSGAVVEVVSSGLIHNTCKVTLGDASYVLQHMNKKVFADPEAVCNNVRLLQEHLASADRDLIRTCPLRATSGSFVVEIDGAPYRLLPYVSDSMIYSVVESPAVAAAAAKSFGKLTSTLSDFDATLLHVPIADFHNIHVRYQQFEAAIVEGNKERINKCKGLIEFLRSQHHIVEAYFDLMYDSNFKLRVAHHDTKISNVLFDAINPELPLCVIDLDTVMPGYFFSDVGDMIRTYCCSVSEEESDLDKIEFRDDIYHAVLNGYLSEMENFLSETEKECFIFAGKYMIYMQALRFLTDYMLDDVYYGENYIGHNCVRAANQIKLMKELMKREPFLRENRFREVL